MRLVLIFIICFHFFQDVTSDFSRAEDLFKKAKYEEAKLIFESIYQKNNSNWKSKEYLGDIAGHQLNWDEALNHFGFLKTKFPNNAIYQYKYGGCLGMKAKSSSKIKALTMINDIEDAFLKSANLDPKMIEPRWALVEFYLELPGILGGSEKKAKIYAEQLFKLSKVDGYLARGRIEMYFKRYKLAETHYLDAHKIGNSKITYQKLYDLYTIYLKDIEKVNNLK